MGLTLLPFAVQASKKAHAPYILPWSVIARAGMPSSFARFTICEIRAAPSSKLYSVWTCKWTKLLIINLYYNYIILEKIHFAVCAFTLCKREGLFYLFYRSAWFQNFSRASFPKCTKIAKGKNCINLISLIICKIEPIGVGNHKSSIRRNLLYGSHNYLYGGNKDRV